MSCPITLTGIQLGCSDNIGGIVEVYVADKGSITSATVTSNVITAFVTSSATPFKTYKVKRGVSSLTSTPTVSYENDTVYYTSDLAVQFNKLDTAKRTEFTQLAKGNLAVIAKDANGAYWYLGYDNEVKLSAGTAVSGKVMGDLNGYTITLRDISKELPYPVTGSIIAGIIS